MGDITIHPEDFSRSMERHWTGKLGNVSSPSLLALWETLAKTFNCAIASQGERWSVLQPPTGTGKTQGLAVFSSMTARHNRMAGPKNGILIVTRLIAQAEELKETINSLAGFHCAETKHSENKTEPEAMRGADILIITHAAYVKALDGLCRQNESRWIDLIDWDHGRRSLTVIDEALANVIDEYQVKIEDVRQVLSYVTPELKMMYPHQVEALETVSKVLDAVVQLTSADSSESTDDLLRSRVVWRGVLDNRIQFPDCLNMAPLRAAMSDLRYDQIVLRKESVLDRQRIADIVDRTLKNVESVMSKWSYYAKKGKEHSFNSSQLLIPDDLPAPVVLDATANQNFLWELLEDRADIKPIPSKTRSYQNVTLHIARATGVGKTAMVKEGSTRVPRLLANLENTLGKDRKVFLCVHKRIEHIPLKYQPEFKEFSVAHWGAIDGRNDWKDFDTAVIFGLPYRDHVWANNAFFALQGLQTDEWLRNPQWKSYRDVRDELQVKQVTVSIVQAINRIQCRKVIDESGNCPTSDVFIVLPKGSQGDRILEAITQEMPDLVLTDWGFQIDGDKAKVRRNTSHESLLTFMGNRLTGETSLSMVQKELGLTPKMLKDLKSNLKKPDHPLTQALSDMGVTLVSSGYGKGQRSYLLKA